MPKNIDYSNSARNLASYSILPPGVSLDDVTAQTLRLSLLADYQKQLAEATAALSLTPEAQAVTAANVALSNTPQARTIEVIGAAITETKKIIIENMERFGFQDVEKGFYALYQKRVTDTYSPALVKQNLPREAPLLIEETVNVKALEGLIKGKLITTEQADSCIDLTKRKEVLVPVLRAGN